LYDDALNSPLADFLLHFKHFSGSLKDDIGLVITTQIMFDIHCFKVHLLLYTVF